MSLRELTRRHPRDGVVAAIVLRPARGVPAVFADEAVAIVGRGLDGDRRAATTPRNNKRDVTILQAEHVPLIARWTGRADVDVRALRRNLVVDGWNLLAMRSLFSDQPLVWRIGDAVLVTVTGPCEPCSRMEDTLGPGGYNAMRGHGGVTARIEQGGRIRVGDAIRLAE